MLRFQPFRPDDPTRTHDATLSEVAAPDGTSTYRVKLWACNRPTCHCASMVFYCIPDSDGVPGDPESHATESIAIVVNVVARRPLYLDSTSQDERQFGDAVTAALTDADWKWISDYFRASKRKLLENLDFESCDIKFPPDIEIEPGRMLSYAELFPWAEPWIFTHENGSWMIEDRYCTRPHCDCSDALLEFVPVPPSHRPGPTDEPIEVSPAASLWLNLRSGQTAEPVKTPGHPPPHALLKSARSSQLDLDRGLQSRAATIRRLADRLLARRLATPGPSPTFVRESPKTGRNSPCPCGSNRKYKHCCGKLA